MTSSVRLGASKPLISQVAIIGDSISDRGTIAKRELLGFIPMRLILAFTVHTHHGRFTNAYTWDDDFGALMASAFLAQNLKKKYKYFNDDCDIADAIINQDKKLLKEISEAYSLDDDKAIDYKASNLVRTYCEGGLTSANYRHIKAPNLKLEILRLIFKDLNDKREALAADDIRGRVSDAEKSETLILEFTGGNDLITVNLKPTIEEADRAIKARIRNLELMIDQGYKHFVLFLLPDLSMTPRFYAKSATEKNEAASVSAYFNQRLQEEIKKVKAMNRNISIHTFDVNETLRDVVIHPKKYGFDPAKVHTPFSTSKDYHEHKGAIMSAQEYVFWDDIHPSAHTHALLASYFFEVMGKKFLFSPPDISQCKTKHNLIIMYEQFMRAYDGMENEKQQKCFGFFHKDRLHPALDKLPPLADDDLGDPNLDAYRQRINLIFNLALHHHDLCIRKLLRLLGWLDKDNHVNRNFMNIYQPEHAHAKRTTKCFR